MSKFNITVGSLPGTGSTTLGLILSYIYNLKYFQPGGVFRYVSDALGYSYEGKDFNRNEDKYGDYLDTLVDEYNSSLLEKGGYLLVSKTGGFLIDDPNTFSVFLLADINSRADRSSLEGREPRETIEEGLLTRQKDAGDRYKKLYDFNWEDEETIKKTHEFVLDTTKMSIKEEIDKVVEAIKKRNKVDPVRKFDYEDGSPKALKMKAQFLVGQEGLEVNIREVIKEIYNNYKDRIDQKPEEIKKIFKEA